ncbi:hypothetical protein BDW67DRAFT_149566 [Aspergillus spinulosporus]
MLLSAESRWSIHRFHRTLQQITESLHNHAFSLLNGLCIIQVDVPRLNLIEDGELLCLFCS